MFGRPRLVPVAPIHAGALVWSVHRYGLNNLLVTLAHCLFAGHLLSPKTRQQVERLQETSDQLDWDSVGQKTVGSTIKQVRD